MQRGGGWRSVQADDAAVSPVIATMLLLAITVTLSGFAFVMFANSLSAEKAQPTAEVSARALDGGFQIVQITDLSDNLNPDLVTFQILHPDGVNTTSGNAGQDGADGVYGLVGADVSFHDRDARYTVNAGDWFVINATAVGSDEGGWTFRLTDTGSGAFLAEVSLPPTT